MNKITKKVDKVLAVLKDGDVVNLYNKPRFFKHPLLALGIWRIQYHQKKTLWHPKLRPNVFYGDVHTTQFLKNKIFSVEPPEAKYWEPAKYLEKCFKAQDRVTVYRYNLEVMGSKLHKLPKLIDLLKESADKIVGTKYDFGQLFAIAINRILGYDFTYKHKFTDFGMDKMVCSVGVRANFESLRLKVEPKMKRLFSRMNREFWAPLEWGAFKRVDVEATTPALFANSKLFQGEFKEIIRV